MKPLPKPNDKNDKKFPNKKEDINDINEIKEITEITEPEYDIAHIVSASDFTGAMYIPPQSEEEYESYMDLLNMPIDDKPDKSGKKQ